MVDHIVKVITKEGKYDFIRESFLDRFVKSGYVVALA